MQSDDSNMARVPQMDYELFKFHQDIRENPSTFIPELE